MSTPTDPMDGAHRPSRKTLDRAEGTRQQMLKSLSHLAVNAMLGSSTGRPQILPLAGVRKVHRKSTASCRISGCLKLPGDPVPRVRECESGLEWNTTLILAADPQIWMIATQPFTGRYHHDRLDKDLTHTPDLLATFRCGLRVLYIVKPWEKSLDASFREKVGYIRRDFVPKYADRVLVRTERHFSVAAVKNAEMLHHYRRQPDREADAVIADILRSLEGELSIKNLVAASGLGPRAFGAVVRAIGRGAAVLVQTQLVGPEAILKSAMFPLL